MLEKLLSVFGNTAIHRISMLFTISSQVLKTLDQEFKEDKTARNAALDAIIELIQKHKDVAANLS
jgi:hypothetical protein